MEGAQLGCSCCRAVGTAVGVVEERVVGVVEERVGGVVEERAVAAGKARPGCNCCGCGGAAVGLVEKVGGAGRVV